MNMKHLGHLLGHNQKTPGRSRTQEKWLEWKWNHIDSHAVCMVWNHLTVGTGERNHQVTMEPKLMEQKRSMGGGPHSRSGAQLIMLSEQVDKDRLADHHQPLPRALYPQEYRTLKKRAVGQWVSSKAVFAFLSKLGGARNKEEVSNGRWSGDIFGLIGIQGSRFVS